MSDASTRRARLLRVISVSGWSAPSTRMPSTASDRSVGTSVGIDEARSRRSGSLRASDLRRGWDLNPRRTCALTSLAGRTQHGDQGRCVLTGAAWHQRSAMSPMLVGDALASLGWRSRLVLRSRLYLDRGRRFPPPSRRCCPPDTDSGPAGRTGQLHAALSLLRRRIESRCRFLRRRPSSDVGRPSTG
jgi:hypothetical protein